MRNKEFFDNNAKYMHKTSKFKKLCKCGHPQIVPKKNVGKLDYTICRFCGGRLYYDDEKQKQHDKKCERENFRVQIYNLMRKTTKKRRKKNG